MKALWYRQTLSPVVAVVDVGTTKVCTLIGKKGGEGVEILGVGLSSSQGIRKGKVVDVARATRAIWESFALAREVAGEDPEMVYASIAGDFMSSFNLENEILLSKSGREVNRRDLEKVVEGARNSLKLSESRIVHIIPQEYQLDDQKGIADPRGMIGSKLKVKVHVVAAQENHYHNFLKSFSDAGLEVRKIVFQPLASAVAVLSPMEKEIGTALVDIGGGTTDLAIFYGGSVRFSQVLPIGGEHITSDLAIGLRTNKEEAERIKVSQGSVFSRHIRQDEMLEVKDLGLSSLQTVSRKYACEIIEARAKEILLMIGRGIRDSGFFHSLRGGIVLTGGSSLLDGLSELFSSVSNFPIRIGYPESKNFVGNIQTLQNPMFAAACGLLRQAVNDFFDQETLVSLEPPNAGKRILGKIKDFFMME